MSNRRTIHESFMNRSGSPHPRVGGGVGGGGRGEVFSSICLSNWSARETPRMDGRFAAEIGGGR